MLQLCAFGRQALKTLDTAQREQAETKRLSQNKDTLLSHSQTGSPPCKLSQTPGTHTQLAMAHSYIL